MNEILYITFHSPFNADSGANQRSNLLFRALQQCGHVDLVCFTNEKLNDDDIDKNSFAIKFFGPVLNSTPNKNNFTKIIRSFFSTDSIISENIFCSSKIKYFTSSKSYDYIVFRYLQSAFVCGIKKGANVIIDVDDLPEQSFLSLSNSPNISYVRRLYYLLKSKIAKYFTIKTLSNVNHYFIPNKEQLYGSNSTYLPNIPFTYAKHNSNINNLLDIQPCDKKAILFIGLLSWKPNIFGINHFIENIFPIIQKKDPNIMLNIVGKGLPEELVQKWSSHSNINIKGFVENIEEEYNQVNIVIAPIYHGAGTNIKVLEAMSKGKIVVASRYATRGFEEFLVDGENVFIANDDKDFAEKILNNISNLKLCKSIGQNAQHTINQHYSYREFAKKVKEVLI